MINKCEIVTKIEDMFNSVVESGAPIACGVILDGVAGTIMPGAVSAMLSYQQKRQERMYIKFMEEVKRDISIIESNLERLNTVSLLNFKDKYFGYISDYVFEEVQEEKIKYLETGLVNLSAMDDVKEDFVLYYYDTLKNLRIMDLMILKAYNYIPSISKGVLSVVEVMKQYNLSYEQASSIKEKLERYGLLISKRDAKEDELYKNIEMMQKAILDLSNGKKTGSTRFKSLTKNNTYEITRFGRNFLSFFSTTSNK